MGLNCAGPLIHGFLKVNTNYSTTQSMLVESAGAEPWTWRTNGKVVHGFSTAQGLATLTLMLFKSQLYSSLRR